VVVAGPADLVQEVGKMITGVMQGTATVAIMGVAVLREQPV
jgi:hypothetical protein